MKVNFRTPLFLTVLVLLSAVVACGTQAPPQASNENQDTPSPAPATSAAISSDPQTTVTNVLGDFAKAPPYHVTMTVTTDTSTLNMNADVILPDRFHITSEHQGNTTEMLIVGDKSYNKVNGQWVESPFDIADLTSSFTSAIGKDTTISNVQFVKTDTVNGVSANEYTFDSHYDSQGLIVDASTTMWVGTSNGLPLKLEVDSTANDIKSHTEETIEYDPSITIEAPAQ